METKKTRTDHGVTGPAASGKPRRKRTGKHRRKWVSETRRPEKWSCWMQWRPTPDRRRPTLPFPLLSWTSVFNFLPWSVRINFSGTKGWQLFVFTTEFSTDFPIPELITTVMERWVWKYRVSVLCSFKNKTTIYPLSAYRNNLIINNEIIII